jgi:hypothetical protein
MDVLRFVRAAAAPQPAVAPPASAATVTAQRQRLRMWPRGGGDQPAPVGAASARGAEPRSPPDEERKAEGAQRGQGNWVLQMLRVQPRWVDAADAEATGGGQEPDEETAAAAAAGAGGVEECASCGCGEDDEGCAVGYGDGDGEVFDRASFSRLLRKASLGEAKEYSMMSYLCNIAYMIPRIQVTVTVVHRHG